MSDTDHMDPLALDIHDLAEADAQCGHSLSTWRAARMVRGIKACAMVLAAEREETMHLGAYLRGGLTEAIAELAHQVSCELEGLSNNIKAGERLTK